MSEQKGVSNCQLIYPPKFGVALFDFLLKTSSRISVHRGSIDIVDLLAADINHDATAALCSRYTIAGGAEV
jgi:hypothetical protein